MRAASDDLPRVDGKMFTQYVSKKQEGSAGQQKKRYKCSQVEELSMLKL